MGRLRASLQGAKVYFDANIFIYTLEAHPLWVQLLTDLLSGLYRHEFAASTSSLTLSECLVMPFKKNDPNLIKTYREALEPSKFLCVAPVDRQTLIIAAQIRAQFGLKLPDAIHAATAQTQSCAALLTNDTGFKRVPGIDVFVRMAGYNALNAHPKSKSMNTTHLKKYAPQARRDFMAAVSQRLNQFGIHADNKGTLTVSTPVISGSVMQIEGLSFDAGIARAREKLVQRAEQMGFEPLVEQMAYTWFNRLSAIRFMELHRYLDHSLRVLSPAPSKGAAANSPSPSKGEGRGEGGFQPEILDHAQDVAADLGLDRNHIIELKLAGNQDEELYRLLLLGQCHQLHQAMPFLFEALDDETELLLPDNLTRTDSILRGLVDSIPEDDWQNVEIIGWLYQFYISEKKDQVIGKVVKSEDIPAATQLFTPNWIVKYLVQNSVGRQWLMTYPDSGLKARMEYYIEPAEQEPSVVEALAAITPTRIDPETLKVLDPACGSGHILVEAYDILKAIYEERGYRVRDIPKLILEKNLYGLDIDDRAAQLAGFALMMKAREDDRRIFSRDIKLNVLAIQGIRAEGLGASDELWVGNYRLSELLEALDLEGQRKAGENVDLFATRDEGLETRGQGLGTRGQGLGTRGEAEKLTPHPSPLIPILKLFEQAKTLGSLIQVPHEQAGYLRLLTGQLQELAEQGDSLQKPAARVLLPYMQQAWLLAQQYDAVVANPPYMGGKGMNTALKEFAKKHFLDSKSDMFAMFIERGFCWCKASGFNAQVTMQSWMFLSSYEAMREKLLIQKTLNTMAHLGARAFSEISGEVVQTTAFVFYGDYLNSYKPVFFRLVGGNEEQKQTALLSGKNRFDSTIQTDFNKIPGSPIAYWVSDKIREIFIHSPALGEIAAAKQGLATADNDRFLRLWYEVDFNKVGIDLLDREQAKKSRLKWFPHSKGGEFIKWYGNREWLVNWEEDGKELFDFRPRSVIRSPQLYFKESLTWTLISSASTGFRYEPIGNIIGHKGPGIFTSHDELLKLLALLNSCVSDALLKILAPTIGFEVGQVTKIPVLNISDISSRPIDIARNDWDYYEISWDFTKNTLINQKQNTLPATFELWQTQNRAAILEMQRLEEENNRLFIEAYGLQEELTPEVPEDQITLTRADQEKDIQRLLSYSIGCMMGRYRLDRPGLIYAHAGNVDFWQIYEQGVRGEGLGASEEKPHPSPLIPNPFPPDEDGILPLTDQEWFKDDATNRFREFLVAVWGEDTLQQNLEFVADSLTLSSFKPKKGETSLDTVRRYLSNQFYKDHLQTYKKRPIYWLFSSGKQKAFECLVYLHRYNDSTLARMRTEYVTPLLGKYSAYADRLNQQLQDASSSEATRIKKDIQALEKKQTELRQFDDKLRHYADMRIKLDLDDGVKVNYGKFGDLLAEVKAVTGGTGD